MLTCLSSESKICKDVSFPDVLMFSAIERDSAGVSTLQTNSLPDYKAKVGLIHKIKLKLRIVVILIFQTSLMSLRRIPSLKALKKSEKSKSPLALALV